MGTLFRNIRKVLSSRAHRNLAGLYLRRKFRSWLTAVKDNSYMLWWTTIGVVGALASIVTFNTSGLSGPWSTVVMLSFIAGLFGYPLFVGVFHLLRALGQTPKLAVAMYRMFRVRTGNPEATDALRDMLDEGHLDQDTARAIAKKVRDLPAGKQRNDLIASIERADQSAETRNHKLSRQNTLETLERVAADARSFEQRLDRVFEGADDVSWKERSSRQIDDEAMFEAAVLRNHEDLAEMFVWMWETRQPYFDAIEVHDETCYMSERCSGAHYYTPVVDKELCDTAAAARQAREAMYDKMVKLARRVFQNDPQADELRKELDSLAESLQNPRRIEEGTSHLDEFSDEVVDQVADELADAETQTTPLRAV